MKIGPEPDAAVVGCSIHAEIQSRPEGLALIRVDVLVFEIEGEINSKENSRPKRRRHVQVEPEIKTEMGTEVLPEHLHDGVMFVERPVTIGPLHKKRLKSFLLRFLVFFLLFLFLLHQFLTGL